MNNAGTKSLVKVKYTKEQIKRQLWEYIAKFTELPVEQVKGDLPLKHMFFSDTDTMMLLMWCESTFGVYIPCMSYPTYVEDFTPDEIIKQMSYDND